MCRDLDAVDPAVFHNLPLHLRGLVLDGLKISRLLPESFSEQDFRKVWPEGDEILPTMNARRSFRERVLGADRAYAHFSPPPSAARCAPLRSFPTGRLALTRLDRGSVVSIAATTVTFGRVVEGVERRSGQ